MKIRKTNSLLAHGEPSIWGTGGALVIALAMILGLFVLIFTQGLATFWPADDQLSFGDKLGVYGSRWDKFVSAREGGVFPAIMGTIAMTLLMTLAVMPFGVLAALYLREYARSGPITSALRIAINNLAGVPSIVFGVFGLGFFSYSVGGGPGAVLWASLTMAFLTLPVVVVATEEALAAVPNSMRQGSYACGAGKWQTLRWIVLPRAMPGIMTGMILAIARGAGEVAPLLLVGAVGSATNLPLDGDFPYLHPFRGFMHLGHHIYDVVAHSPESESAKQIVYTTTLLLIGVIALLNMTAIWLRSRLRRNYLVSQF